MQKVRKRTNRVYVSIDSTFAIYENTDVVGVDNKPGE